MKRIKHYLYKIREKGLLYTLLFAIDTIWYIIYKRFYEWYLNTFTKIDNRKVLFMSKPDFSDNSKILYNYLYENYPELHFVWVFNKGSVLPKNTSRTVYIHKDANYRHGPSKEMWEQVMTSKYLFFTHGSPIQYIPERQGQLVMNLWHGCGYKESEKKEEKSIGYNLFNYALVPGPVFIETKSKFWDCKKEQILAIGYPRYDIEMKESKKGCDFANELKGNCEKLIIWMPTFRNTGTGKFPEESVRQQFDIPLLQSIDEMKQLDKFCEQMSIILCVKRHAYQLRYSCENEKFNNIKFISNDDLNYKRIEMYSILQYTDALISDYSSIAIDYLLLDKPIAFCLDDFEDYKNTRGFVFKNPLDYMPGYHLYSYEDMKAFLEDISDNKDPYKEERARVFLEVQNPCDYYCDRIWNTVIQLSKKE